MEGTNSVAPLPIPSSYLVLHKLKQWDEHRARAPNNPKDPNTFLARKELTNLLQSLRYSKPKFHHDPHYDRNLHNESASRVDRFLASHNVYRNEWREMGFDTRPKPRIQNSASTSAIPEPPARPRWNNHNFMHIRWLAAETTATTLTELGLPCAIFGSMACKLYGNQRQPNDVDILVLPPPERSSMTTEEIKALIVQHAPPNYHFVLKPARDPEATYKVLHFVAKPRPPTITQSLASMALHDTTTNDDDDGGEDDDEDDTAPQEFTSSRIRIPRRFSSKVDILLPGIMHLPALPTSMIIERSSLPLVPFPVLLLQKLQGWADHYVAKEARYRAKINVDVGDLDWCLNWGAKRYLMAYRNLGNWKEPWKETWSDRRMFTEEFEELSKVRVREFCEIYERLREAWKAVGFDV